MKAILKKGKFQKGKRPKVKESVDASAQVRLVVYKLCNTASFKSLKFQDRVGAGSINMLFYNLL